MIYIEMSRNEDIIRFYEKRSKDPVLFDYNEEGNLVEYQKTRAGRGDPKKTIILPTYTPSTVEDIKEDDLQYRTRLQGAIERFNQARKQLQLESRNPERTMESIFKANQEVAEADEALIYTRFRNYQIECIRWNDEKIPTEKRITFKQLLFEHADQDRTVYDNTIIVTTQLYPLQRMFKKMDNSGISLSEAKQQEVDKQSSIKKANKVLSALGIPSIKKKAVTNVAVPEKSIAQSFSNGVSSLMDAVLPSSNAVPPITSNVVPPTTSNVVPTTTVPAIALPAVSEALPSVKKIVRKPITKVSTTESSNETILKKSLTMKQNKGRVFIGAFSRSKPWSKKPYETIKTVNVTSSQKSDSPYRRDFSPMTPIEGGYKGFWNFESYWQSGKVFNGISKDVARGWWKKQMKPKRKYAGPGSVGKRLQVVFSAWPDYMEKEMQWVQSRKEVYVPEYSELIRNRDSTKELKALLESGKDIMIYDLDGPKLADGTPTTLEVTLDVLRNKINATDFPFGHGFIVAATLLAIPKEEYIQPTAQDMIHTEIPEEEEEVEAKPIQASDA